MTLLLLLLPPQPEVAASGNLIWVLFRPLTAVTRCTDTTLGSTSTGCSSWFVGPRACFCGSACRVADPIIQPTVSNRRWRYWNDLTPRWQCPAGDINGSVLSWHLDQAAVSVYLNLVSESFPPTTAPQSTTWSRRQRFFLMTNNFSNKVK